MTPTAYQDCLDRIYKLGRFGIKLELTTIRNILNLLNNPEKNYNIVHVAGTNGKGSTAAYVAAILRSAGFRTGVYTSPHLVRFNERMTVDGEEISNDDVVRSYEAVHRVDLGKRKATFFEIATAMAFEYFARQKVEWAVIETGMGGRFDATNIVTPRVSIITNLSIEHTDYLGNTIKALAREKGGIIKRNTPLVTAVSQPSGLAVLQRLAEDNNAGMLAFKKDFSIRKENGRDRYTYRGLDQTFRGLEKPLPGEHQKQNLSLALAACELVFKRYGKQDPRYRLTPGIIKDALSTVCWPGRLEHVQADPLVILDGAHNLHASKVLKAHLEATLKEKKLTLVAGILDDKPYEKMLANLTACAHRVILTRPKIDRSLPTEVLKKAVEKISSLPVTCIEDVAQAVRHAIDTTEKQDAVCVAGSLYVAGEARVQFDKKQVRDCEPEPNMI